MSRWISVSGRGFSLFSHAYRYLLRTRSKSRFRMRSPCRCAVFEKSSIWKCLRENAPCKNLAWTINSSKVSLLIKWSLKVTNLWWTSGSDYQTTPWRWNCRTRLNSQKKSSRRSIRRYKSTKIWTRQLVITITRVKRRQVSCLNLTRIYARKRWIRFIKCLPTSLKPWSTWMKAPRSQMITHFNSTDH